MPLCFLRVSLGNLGPFERTISAPFAGLPSINSEFGETMEHIDSNTGHECESDLAREIASYDSLWAHVKFYSLMTFFTVVSAFIGYAIVIYAVSP